MNCLQKKTTHNNVYAFSVDCLNTSMSQHIKYKSNFNIIIQTNTPTFKAILISLKSANWNGLRTTLIQYIIYWRERER